MCTGITPAAVKKSIGLPASLPPAGIPAAVSVFASPLRQLNLDEKHHHHLPGLSHLENYTLIRNLLHVYHDLAKIPSALNRRQLTLPPGR